MRTRIALGLLAIAVALHAQDRDQSLGPWVDGHYAQATGTTITGRIPFQNFSFSTASTSGGGLSIGYGFLPWLSAYVTVDNAGEQPFTQASGLFTSGSASFDQMDAGLRLQLPLHTAKLTPYGLLAYSSRAMSGNVAGLKGSPSQGPFATWGNGWTFGAGLEFFFSRAFTLDASWQQTSGTYERLEKPNNIVFSTGASSSTSSRFLAGVTWHAGPPGPNKPPIASSEPLEIGQQVRVHAGTRTVDGTIAAIDRDTLIVQRIVNDVPSQSEIPVACIGSVERQSEERPMGPYLVKGATIGGILGGFVAAFEIGGATTPPKTNSTAAGWIVGGAVVGGGVAALVNAIEDRYQPVPPLKRPTLSHDELEALCRSWNPLQ